MVLARSGGSNQPPFTNAIRKSQFILPVNIIGSRCNCTFKRYNDMAGAVQMAQLTDAAWFVEVGLM